MFSCILFDVDGTLLDTKKASLLAAQAAVKETLGKEADMQLMEDLFGTPTIEIADILGYSNPMEYLDAVDKYYTIYGKEYNDAFPGIRETLDDLVKRGIKLGIITAKTRWEYDHDFDIFDMKRYFDIAITADDVENCKPSAEPIDKYVGMTGIKKADILFVGDMETDYGCAQNAGVAFAFAGWSGNKETSGADYCPKTPSELLELV